MARRTLMSPYEVQAWTSTTSSPAPGAGRGIQLALHRAELRVESGYAAAPSRTPTSRAPKALWATIAPRATSPMRTSPLAVFATTPARARSIVIAPLAALMRASPVSSPIHVSPLPFAASGQAVDRADPHAAGPAGDRDPADRAFHRDVTGSGLELQRADLVEADVPDARLARTSPSRPVVRATPRRRRPARRIPREDRS